MSHSASRLRAYGPRGLVLLVGIVAISSCNIVQVGAGSTKTVAHPKTATTKPATAVASAAKPATARPATPASDAVRPAGVSTATAVGASGKPAVIATPSLSQNRYVTLAGSDAAAGTETSPWRTIQWAVDHAPAGATVEVGPGTFSAFQVTRPSLSVLGSGQSSTIISGPSAAQDIITVNGAGTTLANFGVTGCVPANVPGNGYEWSGSGNIGVYSRGVNATIANVTISGKTYTNSYGLNFGCFGVVTRGANHTVVESSTITGTGYAIYVNTGGEADVFTNNLIHDNRAMIRNTPSYGDDFGGGGIAAVSTNTTTPIMVTKNTIYNDVAPSADYGTDGQAFEIYGAHNVVFDSNVAYNNENILETGSGTSNASGCGNMTFTNNRVSGLSSGSSFTRATGIILRCAANSTFSYNTMTDLTWWHFWIAPRPQFPNEANNLTISHNVMTEGHGVLFSLSSDPHGKKMTITDNAYGYAVFGLDWHAQQVKTAAAFAAMTGTG
jgi:hypothetical protein